MNWVISTTALLCICYLTIVSGMYIYQRSFMYFPDRQNHSPVKLGLSGVVAKMIATPDGEHLQVWYLAAKPGQPTIMYLHGNAGSIADRTDRMAFYQRHGLGSLFVSYRGYGTSTGTPSEEGLVMDGIAAHDWLVQAGITSENIIVVGESIGAGVAAQLALKRRLGAVIMEAPFTSTMDVARPVYWWLPVDLLMKDRFETIAIIDQIKVPLLIVHGEEDEITPVEQGRQLFAKASEPKTLNIIKGASHNGILVEAVWLEELEFIKALKDQATLPNPS